MRTLSTDSTAVNDRIKNRVESQFTGGAGVKLLQSLTSLAYDVVGMFFRVVSLSRG